MKSILQGPKEEKKVKREYPYFGVSTKTGTVVLYTENCVGTVVHDPKRRWGVGYYSDTWEHGSCIEPLKGKIILSN